MKGRIVGAVTFEIGMLAGEIILAKGATKFATGSARLAGLNAKIRHLFRSEKFIAMIKRIAHRRQQSR